MRIPKPGKLISEGPSLLSPVIKILEALFMQQLQQHLKLASHQHGIRKDRSTTSALSELTTYLSDGLNHSRLHRRTVVLALDLYKSFDKIDHSMLRNDILHSSLANYLKKFLSSYINGKSAFVEFLNRCSNQRKLKMGVPQLLYLPASLAPTRIKLISYADDCTIATQGSRC